jgi:hypothetical protein
MASVAVRLLMAAHVAGLSDLAFSRTCHKVRQHHQKTCDVDGRTRCSRVGAPIYLYVASSEGLEFRDKDLGRCYTPVFQVREDSHPA